VFKGNLAEVRQLLDDGTDPNYIGESWGSALIATSAGYYENIIDILLQHGSRLGNESPPNPINVHVPQSAYMPAAALDDQNLEIFHHFLERNNFNFDTAQHR
jgi:hypothetical protein